MPTIFLDMSAMKHKFCTAFAMSVSVLCVCVCVCVSLIVTVNLLLKPFMYLQTSVLLEIGALGTFTSIYDRFF